MINASYNNASKKMKGGLASYNGTSKKIKSVWHGNSSGVATLAWKAGGGKKIIVTSGLKLCYTEDMQTFTLKDNAVWASQKLCERALINGKVLIVAVNGFIGIYDDDDTIASYGRNTNCRDNAHLRCYDGTHLIMFGDYNYFWTSDDDGLTWTQGSTIMSGSPYSVKIMDMTYLDGSFYAIACVQQTIYEYQIYLFKFSGSASQGYDAYYALQHGLASTTMVYGSRNDWSKDYGGRIFVLDGKIAISFLYSNSYGSGTRLTIPLEASDQYYISGGGQYIPIGCDGDRIYILNTATSGSRNNGSLYRYSSASYNPGKIVFDKNLGSHDDLTPADGVATNGDYRFYFRQAEGINGEIVFANRNCARLAVTTDGGNTFTRLDTGIVALSSGSQSGIFTNY